MKYKQVFIAWIDAQSGAEWEDFDKVEEWAKKNYEVVEVGWEVCSNDTYTVICSQIGNDGSLGNKTKIPNKWIIKKRVIKYGQRNRKNITPTKKNRKTPKGNEGRTRCNL